jgi:hypothetical protein
MKGKQGSRLIGKCKPELPQERRNSLLYRLIKYDYVFKMGCLREPLCGINDNIML